MKLPNMESWCDKFLVAVIKNAPGIELDLTAEQALALATNVLRLHIKNAYGDIVPVAIAKKRKEEPRNERD